MSNLSQRPLKTGGDPRTLADYAALRDELNKLTHPARPDVDWRYAETLCLSLFEHNGVELQTAAWYTLTRTRLAGVSGLNEGLAIIDALVSYQWGAMWPQPVHARVEILSALTQRLHAVLRTLSWQYSDLSALYQAEQWLKNLSERLRRLELHHMSQLDTLARLLHTAAVKLENAQGNAPHTATDLTGVVLPVQAAQPLPTEPLLAVEPLSLDEQPRVYVAQPDTSPKVKVSVPAVQKKPLEWKGFLAGMAISALCAVLACWVGYRGTAPGGEALVTNSLAPLPHALPEAVQSQLRGSLHAAAPALLSATEKQLTLLADVSPRWVQAYGTALVSQARTLWPDDPASASLHRQWQQALSDNALPIAQLEDSYQMQTQVQALVTKLNGLDEQRGKYLTVSELKSAIYAIQQPLLRNPPLEILLWELAQQQQAGNVSAPLKAQIDTRLTQILNRYALITQTPEASPR